MSTENVNKVIDLTQEFLENGKFVFKNVAEALGDIAGVGGLLKALMAFAPEEKDPVMEKLDDLEKKIDTLADKMNLKFDDMKAFITEMNFQDEVITPTSKLTKYMSDCLTNPAPEAFENFRKAYEKNSLLDLAYSVLSLLEGPTTNLLKMAMNADNLKTRSTFDKWHDIINGVLGQFLFLEGFASGLLKEGNTYDSERLSTRGKKLFETIENWREAYKKDLSYWTALPKYLGEYQDTHEHLNNSQKADELKNILDNILTNDAFYLTVFNDEGYDDFNYAIDTNVEGQLIESYKRGKCSLLVYRSTQGNSVGSEELEQMKQEVKTLENGKIPTRIHYKGYPKTLFDNPIHNAGFICMIGFIGEETRAANCPGLADGPGFWLTATTAPDDRDQKTYRRLIAGYL
ncbi:unnamed protein product [Caenorhabditis nigoni]